MYKYFRRNTNWRRKPGGLENSPEDQFVHKLNSDAYIVAKWEKAFRFWSSSDVNKFGLLVDPDGSQTTLIASLPSELPFLGVRVHKTKEAASEAARGIYGKYRESGNNT